MIHRLISDLNPDQLRAVTHRRGPLKIVAGAGTGKTGTLTHRFVHLLEQGVPPNRILALTFSRRAASEFRDRVLKLLDASYPRLWIGTFHGSCLRVLREERGMFGKFTVMSEAEQRRTIGRAVRDDPDADARRYYIGDSGAARLVNDALTLISRTKDEAISLADFAEYADRRGLERLRELANVYVAYTELCKASGRLDFGDLGFVLISAFENDPALLERWREKFDHVMVDEFQDTNEVQWRLLTLLAPPPAANLTVVGDSCQAIYAFRGASSRFFNRFEDEYPGAKSVVLKTNYRSRQPILKVAHALIAHNRGHETHGLTSPEAFGEPVRVAGFTDEDAEADYVARSILRLTTTQGVSASGCAVLCRSVKQSARPIARAFTAYGIPFSVRGYDPAVDEALQDLIAVLRCIDGTATWSDAARTLVRRHSAIQKLLEGVPQDALAQRYAGLVGPNQDLLQAVPPLNPIAYGRVMDWLEGTESWRPLAALRRDLPDKLSEVGAALDHLEAARGWLRTLPLEGQVYAALALVGRLDVSSPTGAEARAGVSACRYALRAAHGLARAGLGIPELIGELMRLTEEQTELNEVRSGSGVSVLTLHAAKGLEWPAVFIVGAASGMLPAPLRLDRSLDLDDLAQHVRTGRRGMIAELAARYHEEPERERAWRYLEEERRLAYVGCTRAMEHLTVTFARTYDRREAEPSTFIAELEKADPNAWLVDRDSNAGVMLPLDVARSARQQALAALGVPGRAVLPTVETDDRGAGDMFSSVLAAQWTASQVAGAVPIRFRELPRPFVEQSTLTVSFSGLESYRTCPRQFFYGHVLQVDASVRSAAATLGSKVHAALRSLSHQWMSSGAPPQDEEVQEVWRGTWGVDRSAIKNAIVDPRAHVRLERGFTLPRQLAQAWQAGGGYLRRYYRWERELHGRGSRRIPVALEHSFSLPYRGHFINGRIDSVIRTPAGDLIIDYKSGKRSGDLQLKSSLQLAIYEKAWRDNGASDAPILGVGYYLLAQDRERSGSFAAWDDKKQLATIRFDEPQREELWRTIDQELAGITANEFAALPVKGKDTCSRCPYSVWCDESLA